MSAIADLFRGLKPNHRGSVISLKRRNADTSPLVRKLKSCGITSFRDPDHFFPKNMDLAEGGLQLAWICHRKCKHILEAFGELVRLQFKSLDRFQAALVTEIIFGVEREQGLDKQESDSPKASDRVENVSARGKTACMEKGKFRRPQGVRDELLLQTRRIDFDPAF